MVWKEGQQPRVGQVWDIARMRSAMRTVREIHEYYVEGDGGEPRRLCAAAIASMVRRASSTSAGVGDRPRLVASIWFRMGSPVCRRDPPPPLSTPMRVSTGSRNAPHGPSMLFSSPSVGKSD